MKNKPILIILVSALALGALFFSVLYLATLISGGKASRSLSPLPGTEKIALVKIEGMLITADSIVEEINNYADDSSVKAILIRIDSPGGGVVASQEIFNAVLNARKQGKKKVGYFHGLRCCIRWILYSSGGGPDRCKPRDPDRQHRRKNGVRQP